MIRVRHAVAFVMILPLLAAVPAPAPFPSAFLTFEAGTLVAVNWVDRSGNMVHSKSVLMQSRVIDATIVLREDETAARSSTTIIEAGGDGSKPVVRDLGEGATYWSDMVPSAIEQVVRRARYLKLGAGTITVASLFRDSREEVSVSRVDATDWVVTVHNKRFEVLTDATGRMLAATLPEFGVVIERREGFTLSQYPLWSPNAAPLDKAYEAREMAVNCPQGHRLAGTLTLPHGPGPFPAAVLITGLGPSNRNGGQPPWMPLRDLADALTRRGIAVLRVDDRGVGSSTGDHASSTTFDEVTDVHTEVGWLRKQPGIDAKGIALVGYSEGGLIAPMVAAEDPAVAAIVTLEGPGVPGDEVARYQIEAAVVRDTTIAPADRDAEIRKQLADTLTAREKSYLSIDPISFARRTRCPALIVHGSTDLHVPVRSAERLAWAMREAGNQDVTVRIFPGISHSLLYDPRGVNSGWVYLPAFRTAPEILEAMSDWLASRLAQAKEKAGTH